MWGHFILASGWNSAHPHPRFPEEVWVPHVHKITPRPFTESPWVTMLAVLAMLLVFVALPVGLIYGATRLYHRLAEQMRKRQRRTRSS